MNPPLVGFNFAQTAELLQTDGSLMASPFLLLTGSPEARDIFEDFDRIIFLLDGFESVSQNETLKQLRVGSKQFADSGLVI